MKLQSLHDLFVEGIQDLYSAEEQIIEALPKMAEKASSPQLREAFLLHLQETREQKGRLDRIFDQLPNVDRKKKCKGIEGILKDGEQIMKDAKEPETRDAGMISGAQHVEHYEIAGYGTVRTYAQLLNHPEWASLLERTLEEEKETDAKLNSLATRINVEAKAA